MTKQYIPAVLLATLACVLTTTPANAQSGASTPRQEIEPLLNEQMLAANAHDTDRFLALYLHKPSLVFVFNGTLILGWDDLRAQQLKWWNGGKSDVVYSEGGQSQFTVLSPEIVVVTTPLESRRTLPDGASATGKFAVTMVWQKRPEGWRIVQAHESTVH